MVANGTTTAKSARNAAIPSSKRFAMNMAAMLPLAIGLTPNWKRSAKIPEKA